MAVDTVPIDGDRAVRCGCDGRGRGVGVEHPGGAAGDHEIDVSLRPHPGEIVLGRDPPDLHPVHHDDPALGHVQACPGTSRAVSIVSRVCASTLWPGKVPGKISLNNPRAAQKTAAVEDRTQTFRERQERRIGYGYGAPLLRRTVLRAMLRLGRTRRLTLERGIRQIIERDDRRSVEQGLDGPDPMVLACLFMFEQRIGRAVQSPVTQGAEVDPQQLTRGAARTVHVRSPAWVALSRSIPRSSRLSAGFGRRDRRMRDAVRSVQGAHRCSGGTGQRPSPSPVCRVNNPDAPAGVWQSVAPQAL